jgi:hypothetical protein
MVLRKHPDRNYTKRQLESRLEYNINKTDIDGASRFADIDGMTIRKAKDGREDVYSLVAPRGAQARAYGKRSKTKTTPKKKTSNITKRFWKRKG